MTAYTNFVTFPQKKKKCFKKTESSVWICNTYNILLSVYALRFLGHFRNRWPKPNFDSKGLLFYYMYPVRIYLYNMFIHILLYIQRIKVGEINTKGWHSFDSHFVQNTFIIIIINIHMYILYIYIINDHFVFSGTCNGFLVSWFMAVAPSVLRISYRRQFFSWRCYTAYT